MKRYLLVIVVAVVSFLLGLYLPRTQSDPVVQPLKATVLYEHSLPRIEPYPAAQPLKVTILDDGGANLKVESTVVEPKKP